VVGTWTFASESDDGSRVFIDGQLVVNNDGLHGMVDRAGQIALEWGFHRFRVEFFENFGGAGEIFRWEGPGTPRAVVPASALFKLGTVMQLDLNGDGEVGGSDIAVLLGAWGPAARQEPPPTSIGAARSTRRTWPVCCRTGAHNPAWRIARLRGHLSAPPPAPPPSTACQAQVASLHCATRHFKPLELLGPCSDAGSA
jgi:hypothetical protein